jgi:membrane fusion protein (multidrug efflux system)
MNRLNMKNRIAALALLALASCGNGDKQAELAALKQEEAALREKIEKLETELAAIDTNTQVKSKVVTVTPMNPSVFSHYIEVQARVEGDQDVSVSAQTMGNVTSLPVKAGDRVSRGQLLATVDDRAIRQNLAAQEAQLELAVTVFNRQKNLWDQQIGSEIQFLDAKTRMESLERQVAALREQSELSRIKSPIDGTVDQVHIKHGQTVAPGVPVARVVNLKELKVTGEVAEAYISKVKKGNPVKIYFPDSDIETEARVDYAGRAINPLNRTFNVEVRLKPAQGTFYPNQVAVLKIADYTSPEAFIVPVGAVMKGTDGEYVFVAGSDKGHGIALRRPVTSGMTYNGLTEVTDGLTPADKVVTFGYQNLVDGDYITF